MAQLEFTLASGRRVGLTVHGNETGSHVVVFCHPAPGSGMFDPDPVISADRDVRIIALDRPGYGSSDPLPDGQWPTVAGMADDIAEYLLALERTVEGLGNRPVSSVSAIGWSAGGRVALALAANRPELVDRVVVFATPAPNEAVPWIPEQFAEMSRRLSSLPAADALEQLTNALVQQHGGRLPGTGPDPEAPVPLDELGVSAADRSALERPGARQRLESMVRDAYRQGAIGVATDILSYTARPWGFEVGDVRAKTLLLYGQNDPIVSTRHADWYASRLQDASVLPIPDAGHLIVVPEWGRALDFIANRPAGERA